MQFEELSLEEKVEVTLIYFKNKKEMELKGQKDADEYIKKSCRKRKQK